MLNVVIYGIRSLCWPRTVLRSFEVPGSLDKAGTTWYFATAQVTSNFPCRAESAPIKTGGDGSAIVRAQLHLVRRAYPLDWYHLAKCKWPKLHEVKQVDMSVKMCISCSWRKREGTAMEDSTPSGQKNQRRFWIYFNIKGFRIKLQNQFHAANRWDNNKLWNDDCVVLLHLSAFFFQIEGKIQTSCEAAFTLFY